MGGGGLKVDRQFVYSLYVLLLLAITYLLNQLDRYMLAIVSRPMAQEIHFGELGCLQNTSLSAAELKGVNCTDEAQTQCGSHETVNGSRGACVWDYTGQGWEYQVLAGPVFIVIYTFVGIPVSFAADLYNRKTLLAAALTFWSINTLLMGFVKSYWQLVVLRFLQGIGEAGCTPFATSIIADYFLSSHRATALGVYNMGIYLGYSLSYALGNFVTNADILGQGWRWTFIISGMPGLLLGPLVFFSMKEPQREGSKPQNKESSEDMESLLGRPDSVVQTRCQKLGRALKPFTQPTLILLVIAGSVRNGAGYVWAYNTQPYFEAVGQTPAQIGSWMSWVPLVGGSVGVVLGGWLSDLIHKIGPHWRLLVLVTSQLLAAPFVAGALFLHPYWAYLSLIPGNIIGEMWVGITLAVALELVPPRIRTSAVAVYLFIISNIGGNMPLLVPPLRNAFAGLGYSSTDSLRAALYILYPGMYVVGGVLFLITMLSLRRDLNKVQELQLNKSGLTSADQEDEDVLLHD